MYIYPLPNIVSTFFPFPFNWQILGEIIFTASVLWKYAHDFCPRVINYIYIKMFVMSEYSN